VPDDVRSEEGHQGQRRAVNVQTVAAPPATPRSLGASAQEETHSNMSPGERFVYCVATSNSPNFSGPQIFDSWAEANEQMIHRHCAVHEKFPYTQEGLAAACEWTFGMGWVEESVVSKDRANKNGRCKPTPEQTARYHTLFPEGFWSYFNKTKKSCNLIRELPRTLHMTGMNATASSSVPWTASRNSSATQQARIAFGDDGTFKLLSPT